MNIKFCIVYIVLLQLCDMLWLLPLLRTVYSRVMTWKWRAWFDLGVVWMWLDMSHGLTTEASHQKKAPGPGATTTELECQRTRTPLKISRTANLTPTDQLIVDITQAVIVMKAETELDRAAHLGTQRRAVSMRISILAAQPSVVRRNS